MLSSVLQEQTLKPVDTSETTDVAATVNKGQDLLAAIREGVSDFSMPRLTDIKQKKLKKVEAPTERRNTASESSGGGVAAILMRRMAIEMSDSEGEDSDWDDDEDEWSD